MADEGPSVVQVVEFMAGAVGKGQSLVQFFQGGNQPTTADIAKALAVEVKQIFLTQLAQEDVRQATARFGTAQQFFLGPDSTYQHAARHGKTNAELIALITGASGDDDGPGLRDLRTSANLMASWVADPSLVDGGQDTINQAATLYLAIQTFICSIERELSRLSSTKDDKGMYNDNARAAAKGAVVTMKNVLMKLMADRCQAVSVGQWSRNERTPPPDPGVDTFYGATLHDGWPHGDGGGDTIRTRAGERHGASDDDRATMQNLVASYQYMLWYGDKDAEAALITALNTAGNMDGGSVDTFKSKDLKSLRDFASWAVNVRGSLIALDRIARGAWVDQQQRHVYGQAKEQDWRWCSGCGVLFKFASYPFQAGQVYQVCPVYNGAHRSTSSGDYLLCYDTTKVDYTGDKDVPFQDGWLWCENCGALNHDGGGNHCPMAFNGPHFPPAGRGAPFRVMSVDDRSPKDVQDGWRWCNKCGAMHWPDGPSVCSAGGGGHSTDGSGSYRIEMLVNWAPPLNGPKPDSDD